MTAEDRLRDEIAKCRRCEACRELVDSSCLVFPEMLTKECLSCRLQFNQLTPYEVMHPMEIISESYKKSSKSKV
jgi:hypothetical protein